MALTAQEEEKKPCQNVQWSEMVPAVPEDTPAEDSATRVTARPPTLWKLSLHPLKD